MIKKIFILALISIAISSCSTYNNGFSKRKYYDFSNGSVAERKTEKPDNNKDEQILTSNNKELFAENSPTVVSSSMVQKSSKEQSLVSNIHKKAVSKENATVSGKKIINQVILKQKEAVKTQSDEQRKGKFWWLIGILGIVFVILSLFASAYIFFFVGLFEIVLAIILLIRYKKSK